jgi:hypothetical protein
MTVAVGVVLVCIPISFLVGAVPAAAAVPDAPTIGTVLAGVASADVTWTPPASDGGSPITVYLIGVYVGFNSVMSVFAPPGGNDKVVTGLTNGTTYRFRVRAFNADGVSAYSKASDPVTPHPATAPGFAGISGAVGGDGYALVSWFTPPDGGSPITAYVVSAYVGFTPVASSIVGPSETTWKLTGLTNGTSYRIRLRAYNAVGGGPYSSAANVTPHVLSVSDLSGAFTGTAVFRFSFNDCPNVDWTYDADYATQNGVDVTLHIEVCESVQIPGTNSFEATGNFSITTPSGSIDGSVEGAQTISATPGEFDAALTSTSGTGVFSSVTPADVFHVHVDLGFFGADEGQPGPVTGTI